MRKVFFNLLPAFAAILLSLACFDAMGQVIYGGGSIPSRANAFTM